MKKCNWMLEYRENDFSPWKTDNIMGHASKKCVLKKGEVFISETYGYARAVNQLTGETINISTTQIIQIFNHMAKNREQCIKLQSDFNLLNSKRNELDKEYEKLKEQL